MGFDVDGCFLGPSRRSAPLVVQLKGVAADEARFERGLDRLRLRFLALLERRNARHADRVIVPSEYSARRAREAYDLDPSRIRVVPEGIDPEPWRDAAGDRSRPVILSVARQYPRKNTRTLLRALPRVAEAVPDVRLRVVGGGPELDALRKLARRLGLGDRVRLLGAVAEDRQVREEYARASCFCLPSLQEGFGIVFLEAMATGLPVVAGRAGAVPEVVPDGEAGVLVEPTDPEALADALVRVLTDDELARRLGHAGRERAGGFTPEASARRFLEAVADLLPSAGREP